MVITGSIGRGGTTNPAELAVGQSTLENTGRFDAAITGVSLVDPHDVELLEVFAADYPANIYEGQRDHLMQTGGLAGWPPPGAEKMRGWDERQPAEGYVLEPSKEVTFLIGLRATGPATTHGLRVEYTTGFGRSYTADTNPSVVVVPDCDNERKYVDLGQLRDEG